MSRSGRRQFVGVVVCLGWLLLAHPAWALRCGSDLVSKGDRKIEVLESCGEPLLIERWEEEGVVVSERGSVITGTRDSRNVEEWTYNFGPSRFIHFLRFVNGRLDQITLGPRGFSGPLTARRSADCGNIVMAGDRTLEVLRKCGEPDAVDERTGERFVGTRRDDRTLSRGRKITVHVEEWTYNFGPTRFLVFITLENGTVVDVQAGDYGF